MKINPDGFQKAGKFLALFFLTCNLLVLCWYLFVGYKVIFHSDSAVKVLLAREIVETGQYFPTDWHYANGDLFVLFGHTFIIPLLAFMPAGYLAHAISGLISAALILSGVWFLTGLTRIHMSRRILVVAIVASGISGFMAENLYGQVSYGVFVYFSCYILFFAYQFLHENPTYRIYYGFALFCVLCLSFWSNPLRAAISFGIPLTAAIVWHMPGQTDTDFSELKKTCRGLLAIALSGFILGAILNAVTLAGVNNVNEVGRPLWLSYDLMVRNIRLTPQSILSLFGALPTANGELVSKMGIYEAARLAAGLAMFGLIPYAILTSLRRKGSGDAFLASFTVTTLAGVLFVQITTTVPSMSDPVVAGRYLVPAMMLSFILVLSQKLDWLRAPIVSLSIAAVSVCFVTSAYPAFVRTGNYSNADRRDTAGSENAWIGLQDFLLENGLHYGYATFWNSGSLSVLSDEKLLVRQIRFSQGLPVPDLWLCSNRWYRSSTWQGKTFLLLTGKEETHLDRYLLDRHGCKPLQQLSYNGFMILVFPDNLATCLPGWEDSASRDMSDRAGLESKILHACTSKPEPSSRDNRS